MKEIKVQIVSEYRMPPLCCACGAPAGKARFKVYASSTWKYRPYSLYVPLCDGCAQTFSTVDQRRRLGCWVGLGLALLLGAAAVFSGGSGWSTRLPLLALLALAGGMVAFAVLPRLLSPQLRDPYRRIVTAAQIKRYRPDGFLGDGSMLICLAHPAFAEQFLLLNSQVLWQEPIP